METTNGAINTEVKVAVKRHATSDEPVVELRFPGRPADWVLNISVEAADRLRRDLFAATITAGVLR